MSNEMTDWVAVDAWLVPPAEAETYMKQREELATALQSYAREHGWQPTRAGAGDEDGEYVAPVDENGHMVALVHLDPETTRRFVTARENGTLEGFFAEAFE